MKKMKDDMKRVPAGTDTAALTAAARKVTDARGGADGAPGHIALRNDGRIELGGGLAITAASLMEPLLMVETEDGGSGWCPASAFSGAVVARCAELLGEAAATVAGLSPAVADLYIEDGDIVSAARPCGDLHVLRDRWGAAWLADGRGNHVNTPLDGFETVQEIVFTGESDGTARFRCRALRYGEPWDAADVEFAVKDGRTVHRHVRYDVPEAAPYRRLTLTCD